MVQKIHIYEKVYLDQLLDFPILILLFLYTLIVPYFISLNAGFFQYHQTVLDPDQPRHFVGPDQGPNCFERLSADDKGRS